MIPSTYELPDGTVLKLGTERFEVPEVLMNPSLLASSSALHVTDVGPRVPFTQLILDSVEKCDIDVRREMLNQMIM